MPKTMRVEIDSTGQIYPIDATEQLPEGRAVISWPTPEEENLMSLSERSLADWLRPEEEEAWAPFQKAK